MMIQNNEIQDQQTAEPLAVVEPQINQEQQVADTEVMQQPTEPLDVSQGEQVASLSSWAARNILKTVKPVEKEVRENVHIIQKPSEDLAAGKLPTQVEETINTATADIQTSINIASEPNTYINKELEDISIDLNNFVKSPAKTMSYITSDMREVPLTKPEFLKLGVIARKVRDDKPLTDDEKMLRSTHYEYFDEQRDTLLSATDADFIPGNVSEDMDMSGNLNVYKKDLIAAKKYLESGMSDTKYKEGYDKWVQAKRDQSMELSQGQEDYISAEALISELKLKENVPPVELGDPAEMLKRANDITNAELKNFSTTDSYQVNFDTIEGGDDVTATIAQMAELNKVEIDEARRGVITDEMLTGLANDLGQDPDFIKNFMVREQGTALSAETVLATRQLLEQSAVRLKTLADLVSSNTATDIDKANFAKQWQFHKQFNNQFMGMRAEFGRGLRAFGVNMQNMEQAKINEVMGMVASDLDISKVAAQISTMDNVRAINNLVVAQDSIARKGIKVFVENFISSILSGVKTQIVNTSGAALRLGMDTPDTLVAAALGAMRPNTQEKVYADEAMAKIFGMVNGFQDAIQTGWKVAKTAEPYGGIDKLDMMHEKAISSSYLGLPKDSLTGKIVDTYGTIVRAPLERVMGGVDGFFKVIGERSQLAGIAYRRSANSGLEGEEATKYLNDLMQNPTPDMIKEMEDFGLDITFQKPLGETGQAFQNVVNKAPALKIFVPFIKTPTNLMKQAYLERSPLGMFSEQYKAEVAAGGARADLARAKMINGTMLSMSAMAWVMNGTITGSDPKDPKVRQARHETGWRPRSFVFKNDDGTTEYISYDRAEPFSYLLGTVADIVEYNEQVMYDDPNGDADKEIENAVTGLVAAFATNTLDKTFMTGVQSIMQTMTDPKRYGKDYIANMMNGVLPFSGLRRDVAKASDDLSKEAFTIVEKLKRGTPGFNSELPDRLDNYGDPIKFDTVLSPWAVSVETTDPVKLEVLRLAKDTRTVAISRPVNRIEGVKLTAEQYHNLVKYGRKEMLVNGLNYRDTLEEVMNSDLYLESPTDDARVLILNSITKKFDEAAKAWLMSTDEELYGKIQSKKEKKINKLIGDK